MLIANISVMGWLHSIACMIALVAGTTVMTARKGTPSHRRWGWWYAGAMLVQAITIMAVYRFDIVPGHKPGPHTFGMFHWMAVASFVSVALAVFAASRQKRLAWAHVHAQAMLFSYYLLVGGLINEMVVRVNVLRTLVMAVSPHAANPATALITREAQTACMMIWAVLALWFVIKVNRDRAPRMAPVGHPLRYSGGFFVALVGAGILVGAVTGLMGWGLIGGAVAGFITARRAAPFVCARWGSPSLAQLRVLLLAIGMEVTIFALLGASGFFTQASRAATWEITLGIVGFHFLIMRFSHGPWMLALGAVVLAWLGLGMLLHLPLPVMAGVDGLIKLGFGAAMVWPLLRPGAAMLEQQAA